jgi:DNA-binding response OmpR family regulator
LVDVQSDEATMRLLICEDDGLLGTGLQASLSRIGFDVTLVNNGLAALNALANESFVAMVLDIGLPDINGLEVLKRLRAAGNQLPVLVLTALDSTPDKVLSLNGGADDFLVKTSALEELVARLRALIRRSRRSEKYAARGLVLDIDSHTVTKDEAPVDLSKREFDVLRLLLENSGTVVTREQIELALYGRPSHRDSNAIDVHIHNLRNKIGADALKTIRGIGYTIALVN